MFMTNWVADHSTVELLYGGDEKERHERMSKILRVYPTQIRRMRFQSDMKKEEQHM